ncbi:MAG TPA: DUF2064 domain-containing protein [Thermoanaerobaculia bacterium]|nr:DUF2064 domain-containing protein [Thermoanaerobaculia bacterium]
MAPRRAIVLFARTPEAEAASKRLPVSRTAPLFSAVAAAWLRAAARHDATAIIACHRNDRERLTAIAPDVERLWLEQCGATFGARLAGAADDAFALGFTRVIVTGIDAPPPADLGAAFEGLDDGKTVIAPASDGGINLIGLTAPCALLKTIEPRQRDVAKRCEAAFERLLILEQTTDIDTQRDLARARHNRAWRPFVHLLMTAAWAPYQRQTKACNGQATYIRPPPPALRPA